MPVVYSKPQDEVLLEVLSAGLEGRTLTTATGSCLTPYIHEEGLLYPSVASIVGGKFVIWYPRRKSNGPSSPRECLRHWPCFRDHGNWSLGRLCGICPSAILRRFEKRGDSGRATAGRFAPRCSQQSPKSLSSRSKLGSTPRRQKMGLHCRHRRRSRRQHLGYRSLRSSRFARHQLRRLSARSHPGVRSLRQVPEELWQGTVRKSSQNHRGPRRQSLGCRQRNKGRQGATGLQVRREW